MGEMRLICWNYYDKLILSWVVISSLIHIILYANTNAIILRTGVLFDSLGMYWLFRQSIREWDDIFNSIKFFAIIAIISAPLIAAEKFYQPSFYSIFGPVTGMFHAGRFRAAGPFPHYIMMGCFWASLLPFFYARIKAGKQVELYWLAILATLTCIYFSASSTPLLTVFAIIIFWNIYNLRMHGKTIFWTSCTILLLLHLVMQAPVWHLMARVNIFSGSTGWHRYFLFDNFIKHVSEWFLLGTASTSHWGHGQQDITNQFVLEGVRGGIISLVVFIMIIYHSVKIPCLLSLSNKEYDIKWLGWGVCISMLGHFVSFWGVSYFGQINMLLFYTFSLIGFFVECNDKKS
jgi:hypothetical protein